MKNQIAGIYGYLEKGEIEEGKREVCSILNQLEKAEQKLFTANAGVNGILNMKYVEIEAKQIEAKLDVKLPEILGITGTDLGVLFGNILDNAIEASPKGSTIFLSSKKQGDFLELTVSNPAPPLSNTEFMALFGKGVTTKTNRDGHGFGLYNILRMTERYHGKILTRNESILNENYVVFGVLMP